MVFLRCFAFVLFFWLTGSALADDARKPWKGSVQLQGRRIDSFLLREAIGVQGSEPGFTRNLRFSLVPGQYRPVAADAKGYYFASNHGIYYTARFRKGAGPGGVWVSKTKAGEMAPYRGDAADPAAEVDLMLFRAFTTSQMRQFAIANYEKAPGQRAK